jgi:hypothetical protein
MPSSRPGNSQQIQNKKKHKQIQKQNERKKGER